jgi:hypothetical protein
MRSKIIATPMMDRMMSSHITHVAPSMAKAVNLS